MIESLLHTLISLSADTSCWSKPIDIISKLMNRDFYKYFDSIQRVFSAINIETLKKMRLNDYINKKINSDCQIKAYDLIKLVACYNYEEKEIIRELVRYI